MQIILILIIFQIKINKNLSMVIINKYKSNLYINLDNFIEHEINNFYPKPLSYIFNRKFNIIRNFIYFYSIFLVCLPFSYYNYKNNQEFKINLNPVLTLLLDDNYNDFFSYYE